MTPFPAPPAAAIAEALRKPQTPDGINDLWVRNLDARSPREIDLDYYSFLERRDPHAAYAPLRSALLPWVSDVAGLFRFFPLTFFRVSLPRASRRSEYRMSQWLSADGGLGSDRFWAAQCALETAVARLLVQKYGETGFYRTSLVVKRGDRSSLFVQLVVQIDPTDYERTVKAPFDSAREWLDAMHDWFIGIDTIVFTIASRSLSAHERLEIMCRAASTSSEMAA